MSPDTSPSRLREMPHSRRGFYELLGIDLINTAGFNCDVVSDTRNAGTPAQVDIHLSNPYELDEGAQVIVVGEQIVNRGAVSFNRWWVGAIPGKGRGNREDVEEFDGQVDWILTGEEVSYPEVRRRVRDLLPEERREWVSDYDPTVRP